MEITHQPKHRPSRDRRGFTLIELLVVIAIISLLVSVLAPMLSGARQQARLAQCLAQLHVLGQGLNIYVDENNGMLPPSRLPKWGSKPCEPAATIYGRLKYRPTFIASMSMSVGVPPFDDPKACKNEIDVHGRKGDRQRYSYGVYVCPTVADWKDERNGSYGYNYQFLGNSRLLNESVLESYKNWPVRLNRVRFPGRTIAFGDSMGTAASYPPMARRPYTDDWNITDESVLGNEGFNLDPPRVDPVSGEMASLPEHRSALDPRHRGWANVLWVDGHASAVTLTQVGYRFNPDGSVAFDGDNSQWSGNALDEPWTPNFKP